MALVASFIPAVAAAIPVPTIDILLSGDDLNRLSQTERGWLERAVVASLQVAADCEGFDAFDELNVEVVLSEADPIRAQAYFKAGSGVDLSDAEDIGDAFSSSGESVAPYGTSTEYDIVSVAVGNAVPPATHSPTETPTRATHPPASSTPTPAPTSDMTPVPTSAPTVTSSAPTSAPTFSPAGQTAVPKITVFLEAVAAASTLTEQDQMALKEGIIERLQAESEEPFDRSKITVVLSGSNPIKAETFFRPGSGVNDAKAREIAAAIQSEGSVVTTDGGATQYTIALTTVNLAEPPQAITPAPSVSPSQTGSENEGISVDAVAAVDTLLLNLIIVVVVLGIVFVAVIRHRRQRTLKLGIIGVLPKGGLGGAPIAFDKNSGMTPAQQIARAQLQQARLEGPPMTNDKPPPQPPTQDKRKCDIKTDPALETYASLGPLAHQADTGTGTAAYALLSPRPAAAAPGAENAYADPVPGTETYETIDDATFANSTYMAVAPGTEQGNYAALSAGTRQDAAYDNAEAGPDGAYALLSPRSAANPVLGTDTYEMIADADATYIDPTYMSDPTYMVCAPDTTRGHANATPLSSPSASTEGTYVALSTGAEPGYENPAPVHGIDSTYFTVTMSAGANQGHDANAAYDNAEAVGSYTGSALVKHDTIWDRPERQETPDHETADAPKQRRSLAGSIRRFSKRISRRDGANLNTPTNVAARMKRPTLDDDEVSAAAFAIANAVDFAPPSLGSTLQRDRSGRMRLTPAYDAAPDFQEPAPPTAEERTLRRVSRDSVDSVSRRRMTPVYYEVPPFHDPAHNVPTTNGGYPLATPKNMDPQYEYEAPDGGQPVYRDIDAASDAIDEIYSEPAGDTISSLAGQIMRGTPDVPYCDPAALDASPPVRPENHGVVYTPGADVAATPVVAAIYATPHCSPSTTPCPTTRR